MNLEIKKKDAIHFTVYGVFVLGIGLSAGTLVNVGLDRFIKLLIGQGLLASLLAGVLVGFKIRGDTTE